MKMYKVSVHTYFLSNAKDTLTLKREGEAFLKEETYFDESITLKKITSIDQVDKSWYDSLLWGVVGDVTPEDFFLLKEKDRKKLKPSIDNERYSLYLELKKEFE